MTSRYLGLMALAVLGNIASARADLNMMLAPSVQNSARGYEVVFRGTLTNTSATEKIFLNDMVATLTGNSATELVYQPNTFFANVPGVLLPGEVYSDSELFRIALKGTAAAADYAGAVTVRGGSDINANTDLASNNFKVLSPAVSVIATDASASEFGPDPGTITIGRTGGTEIDLPVVFTISGSALNGLSYAPITPAITIPAGSNSAVVTITPVPNDLAEGDRTALLTLSSSSVYNASSAVSDAVVIHDKPADAWRFENFGAQANTAAAADTADWDGDGIPNLLEFALDLDPKSSDPFALPAATKVNDYLTISYVPNANATDVVFAVEASTNLSGWSTTDVEAVSIVNPNPPGLQMFRYKFPTSQSSRAFLRLHVVRTDLTGRAK